MAKLVSKTYGDALFAVACEEECIDEFFEAAVCVVDSLWANEEFSKLMNHPNIGKEAKNKNCRGDIFAKDPKRDHRTDDASHRKKGMRKICVPCSNILSDL